MQTRQQRNVMSEWREREEKRKTCTLACSYDKYDDRNRMNGDCYVPSYLKPRDIEFILDIFSYKINF